MSAAAAGRDLRIDFLRGFFILMVCVDHFDYLTQRLDSLAGFRLLSYQHLGWSSAAEFFVFFSGYVMAGAYGRTLAEAGFWRTQLRAGHRAWELYARNALVFLLAMALLHGVFAGQPALLAAAHADRLAGQPDGGMLAFMTLRDTPAFFEVLQLYMVLVPLAPVFLWVSARARHAALGASALVWLVVQGQGGALNLHNDAGPWNFNPFAWQFLFFLGMWLARELPLPALRQLHSHRRVLVVCAALLLCTAVKALDKLGVALPLLGAFDVPGTGKTDLGPLRLLHFLLVLGLIGLLLPGNERVSAAPLLRGIATVGRHSLDCFCFGTLLAYFSAGLFAESGRGALPYLALLLLNLGGPLLAGLGFAWLKAVPWRARPAPPVAEAAWSPGVPPLGQRGR